MMTTPLEERVTRLEAELRALQQHIRTPPIEPQVPWWEAISGTFADAPMFDEVVRLGQHYRREAALPDDTPSK